ncbi:flagellar hook-basal body protein [Alteribacter keqinensis]|uniref:Flagellar hook-basal body protein n=1 Tax=Alteribacter keqinensis TaxID=2483800 RepID=A0A3M7TTW3_9BACI|nr:flagellar hook-basal body protein [Alteribacter keqinensis]RNA67793.1 flagellar hook-basal body protein [Alteribacter keqinensis]
MLRGLHTTASAMIAQQRRQEMLTDNLANANTPGFKADQGSLRTFPNMLIQATGTDHSRRFGSNHVGELATGVYMQERTPDFTQGDIQETGNVTDLALLQGNVPVNEETGQAATLLYTVESDDGTIRYTRNGNFTVDGAGFLTTSQGNYVLDSEGERINTGNEQFTVNEWGEILTGPDQQPLTQLNVAIVPDPAQLVKEGNGLLRYEGEEPPVTAVNNDDAEYQIQQGFIERSNVDAARTMTEMMATLRSFEANQRMLQSYDKSMERAVNDVGRIG